jgi:hypothetical protein
VVHAPTVFVGEIAADLSAGQRSHGAHVRIALGVVIHMVHAKQKRVDGLPRKGQWGSLEDGVVFHGVLRLSDLESLR